MSGSRSDGPHPFYQTAAEPNRDRLLLISYHFPPGQATGALRWQRLSQLAAERGWALDVVSLDPAHATSSDTSRLDELPPGVRIFGVPEPRKPRLDRLVDGAWQRLKRARSWRRRGDIHPIGGDSGGPILERQAGIRREEMRWLPRGSRDLARAYFAWLNFETERRWARAAAAVAMRLEAGPAPLRAVIACGPPQLTYEAGRLVGGELGIPFIMDMRDPWSTVPTLHEPMASPLWYRLAGSYERRAVGESELIVTNTAPAGAALQELYPGCTGRVITVMNGFDDEPIPPPGAKDRFIMAYAGAIYTNRNPRPLFRASARVIERLGLTPSEFGIEFMGHVSEVQGVPLETMASDEGVGDFVRLHPPSPRSAALEFLASAAVLVSLPQDVETAIPSKVFDYMRYHAWLLVMEEAGSATAAVLDGSGADLVAPNDLERLESVIETRYREFRAGRRPEPIADRMSELSRRAQGEILFGALERTLNGAK